MKSFWIALHACILLSSCQSTSDTGLKSQPEVMSARRVVVSQSESLDRARFHGSEGFASFVFGHAKGIALPRNYTAQAIASALPSGITAKVVEELHRPRVAANRVVQPFRDPNYASAYEPIAPMRDYDLIIQICPKAAEMSGGGYYNAAAGAYIPMGGGSVGGYAGGYDPIMRTTTFSAMLDVYVYRGVDGKCLGSFYFSFPSLSKKEDAITAFKKHVDTTSRLIVQRIFGR